MQRQGQRDTRLELEVRRRLHATGARYRVDARLEADLTVRADLAWKGRRLAVFLDGCFWHGCPQHATTPRANREWWVDKIAANVRRDRRSDELLRQRGWQVLRFWEHDAPDAVVAEILAALHPNG